MIDLITDDPVTEYARRVLADEIDIGIYKNVQMGELHKLACKRHLEDLERQNTPEFPYHWDKDKAARFLRFSECLTILEGFRPKKLKLMPFQVFDLGCLFGWINNATGRRRFRRRYKSIARQNGKSMENGAMLTYISGFSGYKYGLLFTAATKKDQAKIAWKETRKFIEADDNLSKMFKIKEYAGLIECKETHCEIKALSKEGGLDDGFRSIFTSLDEIHQMKDNSVYKALYNGTKTLDETMVSMITTRGKKIGLFASEIDAYAVKILRGEATAEDFFVDIYCPDADDNIWAERNWIKANPFLFEHPNMVETFRQDAQTAKDMGGSEELDFIVKSLNLWPVTAENAFIDAEKWRNSGSNRSLKDFAGSDCYVGIDLSSGGDLTTYSIEIPTPDSKTFIHSHSFMPRGRMQEHIVSDVAPYDLWEKKELITVTGGAMDFKNDYGFILKELRELKDRYDLNFLAIGVDPHNFDGIRSELESFGCDVITVTQSARNLHDATTDMQLLCKSEKLEYNKGNELLTWSFLNAQTVANSFDEIKVDKMPNARNSRIDPVDAAIDAHYARLKITESQQVDLDQSLSDYLAAMDW